MNRTKLLRLAITGLVAIILLRSVLYIVDETEQVVVTQFGKPVRQAITNAGIKIKIPFIEKINRYEKRFLAWDGDPNEIPTLDKRYIKVDVYARWQIVDPLLFRKRVQNETAAQSRLDDIIDGATRNAVAKYKLVEIVRNTSRKLEVTNAYENSEIAVPAVINVGRSSIAEEILSNAGARTRELGIALLDMRFKRLNYSSEVQDKVFQRMISERKRAAERFRSEGKGRAFKIKGDRERDLKEIMSEAYRQAQEIKGKADAQASRIYAGAYNQNQQSRDFYQFMKTMETYETTFMEKDWLVLSTKSDFYKYLQKKGGN